MGRLISNQEAIENIRFVKLGATARKAERVVMVDKIMVARLEDGCFAASVDLSGFAYVPGNWPWLTDMMNALVKLGAITPEQRDRHVELCEARSADRARAFDAQKLMAMAGQYGFDLTPDQMKTLGIEMDGAIHSDVPEVVGHE